MSEFNLDREMNIRENIDATGKKWVIYTERGRHLFFTRPEPDRADAVIPDVLQGRWTKRMLLDEAIKLHVKKSWDRAEEVAAKQARRAQAAKEAERNEQRLKEAEASASEASDADIVSEDSGSNKASKRKSSKS